METGRQRSDGWDLGKQLGTAKCGWTKGINAAGEARQWGQCCGKRIPSESCEGEDLTVERRDSAGGGKG